MFHTALSRTSIHSDHALITPESHVELRLPGWPGTRTVALISSELGAGFGQYLVHADPGSRLCSLNSANQYLLLVLQGSLQLEMAGEVFELAAEGFAYVPKALPWNARVEKSADLLVFEKRYVPVAGVASPDAWVSRIQDCPAQPFLGDPSALLQCLLPDSIAWDWAINVFEFAPGGTLPNVETHFMEHGLYLLSGQGIYRLGERWYPVLTGDAIWMAPYLPQWFAATGKSATRYIYYKEMNRAPAV
ncbi:MAG: (S)-ureidoglycine aminohydrolase [Pseudomonadales bacterium]